MADLQQLQNDDPNGVRVTLDDNRVKINQNFDALNTAKYEKPSTGIPETDLATDVQNKLNAVSGVTMTQVNQAISTAIANINLFPVANSDVVNGTENVSTSGNVLTNDTTSYGTNYITKYRVYTISHPEGVDYTAGVSSTTNPLGTFQMNANGAWTLTPRLYSYGTFTVNYWVANGITDPVMGTLTINLAFVNQAPVTADDVATGTENVAVTLSPLGNDFDPEGSALTITKINGTAITVGGTVAVTNATVLLNANMSVTVTPATNYIGVVQFTYSASDGTLESPGNVSVTFSAPNGTGGTSNYVTGTSTTIPFNFVANIPAKNNSVVEPTTGATVKRLTDVTIDAPGFEALYNAYSRYPCENVTGEYVLAFGYNSTTCFVLDRATGTILTSLAYDNSGLANHTVGAYHEVRWHYTLDHPYRVYFVLGTQFWMIDDVRNQSSTRYLIRDFATDIDWTGVTYSLRRIYNDQEGNSSLDSDHWAWMAAAYDGSNWRVRAYMHYQISTNTLHMMTPAGLTGFPRLPAGETGLTYFSFRPNMVEMAPDGSGVLIHSNRAYSGNQDSYIGTIFEAPYLWPRDFNPATFTPFRMGADSTHSGWTYSAINNGWYFTQQDNRRDYWMGVPISGPNKGYGNEGQIDVNAALNTAGVIDFHKDGVGAFYPGMHFGVCHNDAADWVLVTTYSVNTVDTNPMANTIFMMQLKPEADTVKWMVAPAFNIDAAVDKEDYNESPASINLLGTRIITDGDFCQATGTFVDANGYTKHYVDMWEIALPTNYSAHFSPSAPVNLTIPTIAGTAQQGQILTAWKGNWSGYPTPTYTYQWYRDGVAISLATATTYQLVGADVGHTITVTVGANNGIGSTVYATSLATATVTSLPVPVNSTIPVITGTAQQGQTLTTDNGTWTNSPTSYTYQWYRGTTPISGATSSSYTLVGADVGSTIKVAVLASNTYGPADSAAFSNPTATVTSNATISLVGSSVSTDPSPGSNVSTRQVQAAVTAGLGDLIVVDVHWDTNGGTNTGVTIDDGINPPGSYIPGPVVAFADSLYHRVQQFWCLSSLAGAVQPTVTNAGVSTPLNVSCRVVHASSGTTWGVSGSTITEANSYTTNPVVSPAFAMPADSIACAMFADVYGFTGTPTVDAGDTLNDLFPPIVGSNTAYTDWTVERVTGSALTGQTMTANNGLAYTRTTMSITVFQRT